MSDRALRSLVAHAVVDRQLRSRLLAGERELVLVEYGLNDEERAALCAFRVQSLQGFAAHLERWMGSRGPWGPAGHFDEVE